MLRKSPFLRRRFGKKVKNGLMQSSELRLNLNKGEMKREQVIIFEGEHMFVAPKNTVYDKKTGMTHVVPEFENLLPAPQDGSVGTGITDPTIPPAPVEGPLLPVGTPIGTGPTPPIGGGAPTPVADITTSTTTTTTTAATINIPINLGTAPLVTPATTGTFSGGGGGGGGSKSTATGATQKTFLQKYWWLLLLAAAGGYYLYKKRKK